MSIIDYFSFQSERTKLAFAKRVSAADLDVPDNFIGDSVARAESGSPFKFRLSLPYPQFFIGFRFKFNAPTTTSFLTFMQGNTEALKISLVVTGTIYSLIAIRGGTSTTIWSMPYSQMANDEEHFLEVSSTKSTTQTGKLFIRVDGFPLIDSSTLTTTITSSGDFDGVKVELEASATPGSYMELRDLWIAEEKLGHRLFATQSYPKANGAFAGWTPSGAGSNFDTVNDAETGTIDDDATFVESVPNQADTYRFTEPTIRGRLSSFLISGEYKDPDVTPEDTDFLKYEEGVLSSIGPITVTDPNYARKSLLLTGKTTDPNKFSSVQYGHGDPGASETTEIHNSIILFGDDLTVDALQAFDAINPYTGDDPSNAVSQLYIQSPTIDAFAADGVVFLNAYANSVCSPSRASLLSGLLPFQHHAGTVIGEERCGIEEGFYELGDFPLPHPLLAHLLKNAGVTVAIVGKWHLAIPEGSDTIPPTGYSGTGWTHIVTYGGFDVYACSFRNLNQIPYPAPPPSVGNYFHHTTNRMGTLYEVTNTNGDTPDLIPTKYSPTVQINDLIELANSLPEPFCIYVPLNSIHGPFNKPPSSLIYSSTYNLTYPGELWENSQAMMEALDKELGRFMDAFDTARKDKTTIIFMGDNGSDSAIISDATTKRDLGSTYETLVNDNTPDAALRQRFKAGAYDRGGKIPLIISGHTVLNKGRESLALAYVGDIFATILDIHGVAKPTTANFSYSLLPVMSDTVTPTTHIRQELLIEMYQPNGSPPSGNTFPSLWNSGTSYSIGDKVWYNHQHTYISLQNGNLNHTPSGGTTNNAWWAFEKTMMKKRGFRKWVTTVGLETGLYSLVRVQGQVDEFYKLRDVSWNEVDPYELSELDITVGGAYRDEYLEVAARLLTVLTNAPPSASGTGIRVTLADGSQGLVPLEEDGTIKIVDEDGIEAVLNATASSLLPIVDEDGNPANVEITE